MVVQLTNTNTNFFERTPIINSYISQIRKYNILSKEDEDRLFGILQKGTVKDENGKIISRTSEAEEARNAIANANQRIVLSVARHYTAENILDCVSEGMCGLMEAIDKFDSTKNTRFITYAIHYIRRDITQYLRDDEQTIRKTNSSKTYHCIARARNEFLQKEEREPTLEELMDILNEKYHCDIKNVNDLVEMNIVSIDEPIDDDDDCMMDGQLFNEYSASTNLYESKAENDYDKELTKNLFSILTPRENQIISMSFGVNGYTKEWEAKEIAKEIGLTPERVRQIKNDCIKRLQEEAQNRMNEI